MKSSTSKNVKNSSLKGAHSAIIRGINYLYDHQMPNGEFLFYMSGDDAMRGWISPENSIFPSALIGTCLQELREHQKVEEMLMKTSDFLQYQKGPVSTWSHFTHLHRLWNICPQDLDDTAYSSIFLKKMGYEFEEERNKQLILDNRRSDGLFYTWFIFRAKLNKNIDYWYLAGRELKRIFRSLVFWYVTEASRYDVDSGVNANALYYLGRRPETEPVIKHLIHIIEENKEADCDTWYRNPFTIYFFISRNYSSGIEEFEKIRPLIIERLKGNIQEDGRIGRSALETALALLTLLNFRYHDSTIVEEGIDYLIRHQNENGSWNRWIIYYGGPTLAGGYGSEEVTTALCLESLKKYLTFISQ